MTTTEKIKKLKEFMDKNKKTFSAERMARLEDILLRFEADEFYENKELKDLSDK